MFSIHKKEKIKALKEELSKEQQSNASLHELTSSLVRSLSELKIKNEDLEQQVRELSNKTVAVTPLYYLIAHTDYQNTYYFQEFSDKQKVGGTRYFTRQEVLTQVRYLNEIDDRVYRAVPVYGSNALNK